MKKYKLLKNDTKIWCGTTVYRIKALRDFGNAKKGELGGYIEKKENLSHGNNAWVGDNALVIGNAVVTDNARVGGNAMIIDNARVDGNAMIIDNARVGGSAVVTDNAVVCGNARVSGNALIIYNAVVTDNAVVCGNAVVDDNAKASCKVLNLNYFNYNITLTDDHIRIGCKQFTYEIAIKLSKKDCGVLFTSDEFKKMWKYKKLLLELIKVKRPDLFKKEGK